jgi:hypothetical protein
MKRWSVPRCAAGLLAVTTVGLVFVGPELSADRRSDPGQAASMPAPDVDWERERVTILNHLEARLRLAREVSAGRLTLRQGAEQLRDLHAVNPYFKWECFRAAYPGVTDLARCCRQLQETIEEERAKAR